MTVAIIDYGSGNLRSAAKAFERAARELGTDERILVTSEPGQVAAADRVVLPGVGAFADCMRGLTGIPGMTDALRRSVHEGGRPFLGICVGMQLMARRGVEHGVWAGLGWLDSEVVPLRPTDPALKIPHMGWNELSFEPGCHPFLDGIEPGAHAYFVHSFHMVCADPRDRLAIVDHGGPVTAVVGRDNLVGTQFHPEKSQQNGLRMIGNFLKWRP